MLFPLISLRLFSDKLNKSLTAKLPKSDPDRKTIEQLLTGKLKL